jgi:hypothetical protein
VGIGHPSKRNSNCPKSFLGFPWLPSNNQTVWATSWCGQRCQRLTQLSARVTLVETNAANVVNISNTRHRIPVRSPENSTKYFTLLIARVQMLFTCLSVPFVASNTLVSLSSPSTHAWMNTEVTLQKTYFFLWAITPDCLTTVSRISTEWKSSLNRTVCGVIFNVRFGKDFGLKNSVFYIRTVITENNRFLCIFSFTVFIVNKYFTTVTKLRICAHHLLITIILSILKCVTLYQVTIIPSYLYSEMREIKIFNTSHFVTWLFSEL